MTSRWITSVISGVALIGVTLSSALPAPAEQAPDKNGPGVTRVSIVEGQVVVQRGDSNKQVAATVNAPLLPGDYISTGASARGELQFDGSTAVRLGGNVQARITNDDPNNRQLQLADGTVELGLTRNGQPVQVDTPSVTVRSQDTGDYRVSIGHDGSTWVTTRRGTANVVTPQRTYTLESGRTLVARGSASDPSITYTSAVGYDAFDDFNAKRDQTMVAALEASPNLNPDIAGYDNLGQYGQWQDISGYGQSWVPNQQSGWSPYANGSWTWEDGYGWTWVGNEPWGWAPYHYGNWFYANNYGWAWAPPAYGAYPAWSPALVGFFGFGVGGAGWGVNVGFGFPNIGWYPIAPFSPWYPWWPGWAWGGGGWGWGGWGCCGYGYGGYGFGRVVNVTNITNITNINRISRWGGVHGVSVGRFGSGSGSHVFRVDPHNIGNRIGEIHGAVPISPTRDSLGFGRGAASSPVRLSRTFDSPRFASANRALSGRMSFDQQARAVSHAIATGGRDLPASHENARTATTDRGAADRGTMNRGTTDRNTATDRNATIDRGAMNRANESTSRESGTSRESAPTSSWQRFNQDRGMAMRGNDVRGSDLRSNESYSRGDTTYGRDNSYQRSSYPSYARGSASSERNPYESYSRSSGSYPSYARPSSSYPSYSRGSYPSYSRSSGSYPSYSRGSYPSYSRGSYPSYSRGSYPSYSGGQPSYQRSGGGGGGYSAPHPSGGGGGGGGSRGGGGGGGGGGHRPPR